MRQLIEGPLRRTAEGYEVAVRLDWYRSLPLSCVSVSLTMDGQRVPDGHVRFHVNDRDYALDELSELCDEVWFVLDSARLRVRPAEPLPAGAHDVAVDITLRIPYLFDEETGDVATMFSEPRATLALA
ncbi:MAG TPA: DUF6379 domain-containing protein [Solirubrobacteraceae bacterium]|jgi:hypothetical protein